MFGRLECSILRSAWETQTSRSIVLVFINKVSFVTISVDLLHRYQSKNFDLLDSLSFQQQMDQFEQNLIRLKKVLALDLFPTKK